MDTCWEESSARMDAKLDQTTGHPPDLMHRNIMQQSSGSDLSSRPPPQQQPQKVQQMMMMYPHHHQPFMESAVPVYYHHHHHHLPPYQNQQQNGGKAGSAEEARTVWIGDLHHWMDETYLHTCFNHNNQVSSIKVVRNKLTGQTEGYGFVEFHSHEAAEKVLQSYNGATMPNTDQPFRLNWASFAVDRRAGADAAAGSDVCIFVGDLAADVTDTLLLETFAGKYPSVRVAKVVVDSNTGRSKGYGFVRFGDENERSKAIIEMNGVCCSSRPMRLGVATPRKMPVYQTQYSYQAVALSGGHGANGAMSQGSQSDADSNNTTIFVGGIGSDVTDEDLRQPFSQFGELVSVKIPAGKGCGFVQFANRKNAKEALESLNGTVIGKQTVRLSWGRTPANKHNTSLQPVSEQSCVTTEDDENETAYNKAREVVLKRFAAKRADRLSRGKRSAEDEDDKEQQLGSKSSTFSCVMADALKGDGLQNTCSSLELMLPRLVREEVQHELSKLGLVPLAERPSAKRIEGPYGRNLQLHFRNNLSRTLFTGAKVEGEQGAAVHVVLLDANSGRVVTSGPESSIKLDVVVLDGDFQYEDDEDWTHREFQTRVVHERNGRRPLLTGDLQVALKEGVGTLGDLVFTDNTSWIRSRKFRLGLKVASGFFEGIRIREAKTEAFVVKDHRGELYKKHFPPLLNDNVWRLEKIAKNGVFHKRLNNHEIFTVEDFLCHMAKDSAKLRNILGGVSDRVWYTIQEHAKTCVLGEKFFAEQYFASGSVSDLQKLFVDSLVKKENENQIDVVEFDGKSHLNLKQSKGPSGCNNDYQGLVNMEEVQGAHTVDSAGRKDRPSKVWTVKGVQDCHIPHSVRTASRFYNLRDRPGCHQTSKAVRLLIEVVKSTIDQFAELPAWQPSATSVTKSRSAAANQPFRSKEDEPQKSQQQQEPEQIGCGSWRDFNSLVDFFTFLHQLDPSAVHHPGSSVLRPSLDSDAIADTIKSFFSIGSSSSGGSQNLFQSHPVPSLLQYIKEVQDILLHVSSITNIDLGADSLTRILGMSKLKVYNLFCKVPKSLPSIFQAENFVELHLPHYNHRLIWGGKLAFVNLRLINLKHSLKLITLPDLSMAQKIVHLNLRGCVKLIQVSYIRNLVKLEELNLSNCENIKILPSLIGLQNLREFYLSGCSNLRELPPSIIALNSLVVLDLKNCAQLYALPRFTSGLQSLQKLNISGCTNILRSLDMKGNRESYRLYGRFLGSTICAYRDLSTPGRASQFVEAAAAPEQKKSTTKKAKKNSAPQVVQVEITEEKELTINNFNRKANKEKEERKRKSVEPAVATCKEVRVKRSCNDPDDCVSIICQPFHEPEAVEKFSGGQGRESKLMDSSVSAPRSSAVLVYGPNLTGSTPEAVEEAILDSGSKLIGDTEPAPANQSPNLNKNTLLGLAIEDPTSREVEDVGLGNSSDHPREECTERVPLNVGKTAALCDPHKPAEKSSDGGMESNIEVFNHQPSETEPLSSYEENDEIDWLKNEIQKLQEQLAASEKRRDGFRECYDSLESELWPLRAELEAEHVNLTEQKQKQEESELEASNAWEDLKKLVAQTIF